MRRLKATLKKSDRLFFLIGIDAFRDIAKWREARALLAECEFIVASRPGYSLRDVAEALPEGLRPSSAVTQPFENTLRVAIWFCRASPSFAGRRSSECFRDRHSSRRRGGQTAGEVVGSTGRGLCEEDGAVSKGKLEGRSQIAEVKSLCIENLRFNFCNLTLEADSCNLTSHAALSVTIDKAFMAKKTDLQKQVNEAILACQDKQAEHVTILELEKDSGAFTDYFVMCSGTNPRQVQAIADAVDERLEKRDCASRTTEGYKQAEWVLLDYVDFVVHIFSEKARQFYDLERLWKSAKKMEPAEFIAKPDKTRAAKTKTDRDDASPERKSRGRKRAVKPMAHTNPTGKPAIRVHAVGFIVSTGRGG